MKFYMYIKETIKKNLLKMFIYTLWYDNIYDYDFFRLKNVLPLNTYLG
jgi:hypothetical protein